MNEKSWLTRPWASGFFEFSAILSATLILFLFIALTLACFVGKSALMAHINNPWIQTIALAIGLVGAPSAICLWVGMLWHSSITNRAVWFFSLILGNWLVAPIYYVRHYRIESGEIRHEKTGTADGVFPGS